MPDENYHTPKGYLVKKPSYHCPKTDFWKYVRKWGTILFHCICFSPFKICMVAYLFNEDFTFIKIVCLGSVMDTVWAFLSLDPVEINVDSKTSFLWPYLCWVQSLSLPVPPGPYWWYHCESLRSLHTHGSDIIMMLLMTTPLLIIWPHSDMKHHLALYFNN